MFKRHDAGRGARLVRDALSHADALHNFARHLTRDAAEAEDLVQETFARALGAADRFVDGSNLKAWIFRILQNTFIDLHRRRQQQRGFVEAEQAAEVPSRDDSASPQWRQVAGRELEAAMSALGEDARTAILLDLEGFDESEMAQLLDCAPGTVKSRLFRARAQLREKLGAGQ